MQRRPLRFVPGSPLVPRPATTRGRWLARQRIDDAAGRYNERLFVFTFPPINPGAFAIQEQSVTSLGGRFVRALSWRANITLPAFVSPTGLDMANMSLRVQLNGQNDLVGGNPTNFATLASLFQSASGGTNSPWFQWLSPPVFRAGDLVRLSLVNTFVGEGASAIGAQISWRIVDDDVWQELWNRDARAPMQASPGGAR